MFCKSTVTCEKRYVYLNTNTINIWIEIYSASSPGELEDSRRTGRRWSVSHVYVETGLDMEDMLYRSWRDDYCPQGWRRAKIISLLKEGSHQAWWIHIDQWS